MSIAALLLWTVAGAAVLMTLLWYVQVIRRDATIVDVGWAFGMLAVAVFYAAAADGDRERRILCGLLAGGWAARLGLYLLRNRVLGRVQEDGRYQRMRAAMGRWAQLGFFAFFHAQTLFVVLFAVPLLAPMTSPRPLGPAAILACAIWCVAVVGEHVADRQLAHFRAAATNAGRTCRTGLWRYSRHPNYFFEWLHWFAYIPLAVGSPVWWLALAGPPLMLLFLFKITGIPHTETQARSHRPDYADYCKTTSMFFPWFPRNAGGVHATTDQRR